MTSFHVDQFLPHAPEKVWRHITDADRVTRWWAEATEIKPIVGHTFTIDMGEWGKQPCEVLEVVEPERFVYSFTERWTLIWTLAPEGDGTRLFLEHAGFDLDDPQDQFAFENMGIGWRDRVFPHLAETV